MSFYTVYLFIFNSCLFVCACLSVFMCLYIMPAEQAIGHRQLSLTHILAQKLTHNPLCMTRDPSVWPRDNEAYKTVNMYYIICNYNARSSDAEQRKNCGISTVHCDSSTTTKSAFTECLNISIHKLHKINCEYLVWTSVYVSSWRNWVHKIMVGNGSTFHPTMTRP